MPVRYPIMAVLVSAIIVFLAIAAFRAWRSRANAQAAKFSAPLEWLEHPSGGRQWANLQYVATSVRGEPLNRVTAHGLGSRGFGKITASTDGILIERTGERSIGIPFVQLQGVSRATVAIDRAVETDGLIQIDWQQDGFELSTFLRATSNDTRKNLYTYLTELLGTKEKSND